MQIWLGLLIFGVIAGSWLQFPVWLIQVLGFLLSASLIFLIASFAYAWVLSRLARLRAVRFDNEKVQARVPRRMRWFGNRSFSGARRYRGARRRKGALKALCLQRGCEVLTLLVIPLALGAAVYGLYVENKWLGMALVLGAPGAGIGAVLHLQKVSERLARERRKFLAPQAREALAQDDRPPIVVLRSFRSDGREATFIIDRDVPLTFEEVTTEPLFKYGPVVSIGRPGEAVPPLGALREYVGADWQTRVRELLRAASAVVAILDDTPGLLWELQNIFDSGWHRRLILLVSPGEPRECAAKWQAFRAALEQRQQTMGSVQQPSDTGGLLAVVFNDDRSPEPIVGAERRAEYYRDAVELALWFISRADEPAGQGSSAPGLAGAISQGIWRAPWKFLISIIISARSREEACKKETVGKSAITRIACGSWKRTA